MKGYNKKIVMYTLDRSSRKGVDSEFMMLLHFLTKAIRYMLRCLVECGWLLLIRLVKLKRKEVGMRYYVVVLKVKTKRII